MFWVAVIIIISSLIGIISTHFLGEDNPIEKAMEEIIRLETGMEVDFTPDYPEEDKDLEASKKKDPQHR
jgi:hypothetical protein